MAGSPLTGVEDSGVLNSAPGDMSPGVASLASPTIEMPGLCGVGGMEDPKEDSEDGGYGLIGGLLGVVFPFADALLSKLLLVRSGGPAAAGDADAPSVCVSFAFQLKIFPSRKGDGDLRGARVDLPSDVGGRLFPRAISGVGTAVPSSLPFSREGDLPRFRSCDSLEDCCSSDAGDELLLVEPEIVSTPGGFLISG